LAGHPRLDVVLLRRGGAEVPRGDVHYAVGDPELGPDRLLDGEQSLVLLLGLRGLDEREHLDLVELMHAEDPARVLAGGSGLAAEARREARVAEWQRSAVEDLPGVQRRERDLGGADQIQV